MLQPKWICLRGTSLRVLRPERRQGRGLVEPDEGVELLRQGGVGVVAHPLGVGPGDDADEALQARLQEAAAERLVAPQVEEEGRHARFVAEALIAVAVRGPDALDLHVAVPVAGGGDRARMRAEADQGRLLAEPLAAELTDVQLLA